MIATPAPLACRVVLASASPRRREILALLGIPFRVLASHVDETRMEGEPPAAFAERAARDKALDVKRRLGEESTGSARFVLGADTVVVIDGLCLGKPRSAGHAVEMLTRLSGGVHEVVTGIALAVVGSERVITRRVATRVWFRSLSAREVEAYVGSGECEDKAGAYAVQGLGAGLVSRIEGCYFNVVGLPATETLDLLLSEGAIDAWPLGSERAADDSEEVG